jgi:hypothetical protein
MLQVSRNFTLPNRHDGVARRGRHGRVRVDELIRKVSRLVICCFGIPLGW